MTLKGEEKCAMGAEICALVPKHNRRDLQIIIRQSRDVTLEQLKIQINFRVHVTQTSNFGVYSVDFQSTKLVVENPIGDYTIMDSSFSPEAHIYIGFEACPHTSEVSCNFTFVMTKCNLDNDDDEIIGFDIRNYV